jgi:hypothetical protein
MSLMSQVPNRTVLAMLIFAGVAYMLALTSGNAGSRLLTLMVIELPVFLLIATLASVLINTLAAVGGGLFGGSNLVAAIIAGGLGWSVAAAAMSAATFEVNSQLQPAHAIALAAAWLFGRNPQTA